MPKSRKSTTPRWLRIRSTRLPAAPPATSPSASWRNSVAGGRGGGHPGEQDDGPEREGEEDPPGVGAEMQAERGPRVVHQPQLKPLTRHRHAGGPQEVGLRHELGQRVEHEDAERGADEQAAAHRRLASSSFSLQLMQRRAWGSASSRSKLMADPQLSQVPNFSGVVVEAAERLVDVPEVPALLGRHQELLFPLHGVGALVGHVEGVGAQVAIGALQRRVEGLVVVAEFLHDPGALLDQSLLEVRQLLLVHASSVSVCRPLGRASSCR